LEALKRAIKFCEGDGEMNYLGFIVISITSPTQGNCDLTAEQVVLLMKASAEQYQTIDTKMAYEAYTRTEPNKNLEKTVNSNIVLRWSRDKIFARISDRVTYSDSKSYLHGTNTYSISSLRSKKLVEEPNLTRRRAVIVPGRGLENNIPAIGVYDFMWGYVLHYFDFWKDNPSAITLQFDADKGLYVLSSPPKGEPSGQHLLKFYIDPKKDFIPASQVIFKPDLSMGMVRDLNDLRQTENGFWIPYKYSSRTVNTKALYTAEQITVNEQMPDSLFDFEFPEGTIVTDDRIGAKYKITKVAAGSESSAAVYPDRQGSTEPNSTIQLPPVATDHQLQQASDKAWELVISNSAAGKQAVKLEVFPRYVFVKPDKSEYCLAVRAVNGTTPQLLDFSFESDKMNLASLENQISEKSRLIVNVQRQQEEKGFQKAILSLRFADEKIDVVFVSPPVGDTP